MKKLKALFFFLAILVLAGLVLSCGKVGSGGGGGGGTTTNFTISGKVGTISASGVRSSSLSVTQIIAISANNNKYMTTPDSSGNFSLGVVSGWPYALGFYNKTGSSITLLGYLRQDQVNWHSLPLVNPSTQETDLGTVDIDTTSVEAVPTITLNDLLSQTNLDLAAANLYGTSDGVMTVFTNVDVDGNGVFDFEENKAYMLQIVLGSTGGPTAGEIAKMLNQYNDYAPVVGPYQIIFHASETGVPVPAEGTQGTVKFPVAITGANGVAKTQLVGVVWGSNATFWHFMPDASVESLTQCELASPPIVPSGTYTFEVNGKGAYTFKNVIGSPIAAVGTSQGIIYPVFKMITNAAGYVTEIDYKWMIKGSGVTREATAAEVKAVIVDTELNTNSMVSPSPQLGLVLGTYPPPTPDPNYRAPKKIRRDGNSIDVTDWNVKFTDIAMFSCDYRVNSEISLQFMFGR